MRNKLISLLLDNLWFWASLSITVLLVYSIWVLFEVLGMHGISTPPHHP